MSLKKELDFILETFYENNLFRKSFNLSLNFILFNESDSNNEKELHFIEKFPKIMTLIPLSDINIDSLKKYIETYLQKFYRNVNIKILEAGKKCKEFNHEIKCLEVSISVDKL